MIALLSGIPGKVWAAIGAAGLAAALVIALLATRATLADEKRERALAESKLTISNGSVARLEDALAKVTEDQRALSAGDASRIKASREVVALVDAASQARQAMTDKLLASAAANTGATSAIVPAECTVSPAVLEAWP